MTNHELFEKYDYLVFAKGIDLDAEASPELENLLKKFKEFDRIEKERANNTD